MKCTVTTHYGIFEWCKHEGGLWFRLFGYGLNVINRDMYPPLPSRRKRKVIQLGVFDVFALKPKAPYKIRWS